MHSAKLGLLIALSYVMVVLLAYALNSNYIIQNVGKVKAIGVGVYWDMACSQNVTVIEWGTLTPGGTKNVTVYIKNEGNSMVTLSFYTDNWNPTNASDYMALSWNYEGQTLAPNAVIPVCLTLSVSPDIQGIESFSFDIVISAK